jgi:hypothetical protein
LLGWPGPLTHRQCRAWQDWLDADWNQPSRTDHYLMLIAQRVLQAQGAKVTLAQQRITFGRQRAAPVLSREEAAARSQAVWFARLGGADGITGAEKADGCRGGRS